MSIELNEMTENVGVCDLNVKLNIKLCKNYELCPWYYLFKYKVMLTMCKEILILFYRTTINGKKGMSSPRTKSGGKNIARSINA